MPPGDGRGRSHELGSDRLGDHVVDNTDNLLAFLPAKAPSHYFANRIELIRTTSAPERGADSGLVENPAEREVDDPFAVVLASESIQALDCLQVLAIAGLLEFGIVASQIVASKNGLGVHAPAQQAAADRAVHQG